MFPAMIDAIKEESVGFLFNLEVRSPSRARTRVSGLTVRSSSPRARCVR